MITSIINPWSMDATASVFVVLLIPIFISIVIYVATFLTIRSIKNTKYEFGKGLIKITSGAFVIKTENIEIFRIKGVDVIQDWFSTRTKCAAIVLKLDQSKEIFLPGIPGVDRAYYLQDRIRELSISLRSLPMLKGIVS
jgi:membrane protein YdbS with pleckstrin-like domain